MEPVTEMLHFCDHTEYQMPYILVLWLSIIVLVPFDLSTIDTEKQQDHVTLVKRITNNARDFIARPGKLREVSALILAKLLTRPDVVK